MQACQNARMRANRADEEREHAIAAALALKGSLSATDAAHLLAEARNLRAQWRAIAHTSNECPASASRDGIA